YFVTDTYPDRFVSDSTYLTWRIERSVVLIGPIFTGRNCKPAGRSVLFMTLLSELDRMRIPYQAVDSNRYIDIPKLGRPLSALWVMANAKRLTINKNVSFHGAGAGISRIGGRLLRYTENTDTRLSIRVFGGAFKRYYDAASSVEKERIKRVLRNVFAIFF